MKCILVFLLLLLSVCQSALADIIVVTDTQHTIKNIPSSARLIQLDTSEKSLSQLSQGLGNDPESAARIVRERLSGKGGLHSDLQNAYQGVVDAWSLGVIKTPAVVVDRQYVVYGEPDVARALEEIERFRRQP